MNIVNLLLANDITDFFKKLFETEDFMARWHCGVWTGFHGWSYVAANLMIFSAYFAIPAIIFFYVRKKKSIPFRGVAILFILFILFCGTTHLVDAIIFWYPAYRLNGLLLVCTAIISWITVAALIKVIPVAFSMKTTTELEVVLNNKTVELHRQRENLGDFADIVSHNLRAPLANMTSLMELYYLKDDTASKEKILEKLNTVVGKMNESVDSMSEVVNLQLVEAKSEPINVVEVYESAKNNLISLIEDKDVKINAEFKGNAIFNYPQIYLESIFFNLLSNSIKYADKKRQPKIDISVRRIKKNLQIKFSDNGIGIDLEKYGHKLFQINEIFHKQEKPTRGIGLYLVNKHVNELGGSIEIESEPGKGTTFKILLIQQ